MYRQQPRGGSGISKNAGPCRKKGMYQTAARQWSKNSAGWIGRSWLVGSSPPELYAQDPHSGPAVPATRHRVSASLPYPGLWRTCVCFVTLSSD